MSLTALFTLIKRHLMCRLQAKSFLNTELKYLETGSTEVIVFLNQAHSLE